MSTILPQRIPPRWQSHVLFTWPGTVFYIGPQRSLMKILLATVAAVALCPSLYSQSPGPSAADSRRAVISQYCAGCHNDQVKSGRLDLAGLDAAHVETAAPQWEKVVRKLRSGMMPPAGMKRPDAATTKAFIASLETALDQAGAAKPNPGRTAVHRLNRAEYKNSLHDLLGVEVDPAAYVPPDDASHGFDNMADVLSLSTTVMEGFVRAASKVSRLAVGDLEMNPVTETFTLTQGMSQMRHVEDTPFGARGGIAVQHIFPVDGEYVFKMNFWHASTGGLFGLTTSGEQIEVSVNGERVALLDINPRLTTMEDVRTPPIKVKAGLQTVAAAFIQKAGGMVEDSLAPFKYALSDLTTGTVPGLTGLPHLRSFAISGPENVTGPGDTPSRGKIFVCKPASATDEVPCARTTISTLARQAFRRPTTETDVRDLLTVYQSARGKGDFEFGITAVVQAIISDPEFVFRFERIPKNLKPGTNYRIADLELASRLSYFLWSSAPDEQLLNVAVQGKLKDPSILEQQTKRMLADSKSEQLAANFAGQWLYLRNLSDVQPDNYIYTDFDDVLKESMQRETELFFDNIVHEDRNILDLLTADYTFVNERLAEHYGIPNIVGSRFRRVPVTDENRKGLLGHASILTLTSLSNRTSPVAGGKWVLENIIGTPPPTPPPNVPALMENSENQKRVSVRERMEKHRSVEPCASCHKIMDPIGFALENFDGVGQWRVRDSGFKIDASGQLLDGTPIDGPVGLRNALVNNYSEAFIRTFTEKLTTYALGRGLEYFDMPVVRSIQRDASRRSNRFSDFVLGIVKSAPFQMRRVEETANSEARH